MPTTPSPILDLFESLMQKLGVHFVLEKGLQERTVDELKLDLLLEEEIFWKEKPQIAIIGKIRAGKSTLGNAIFGKEAFEAGDALELTDKVSRTVLPSGIIIYDSPGFAGFRGHEQKARELINGCDLLLYVIRYPGALDETAIQLYEKEIKPSGKSVVTVINVEEGVLQEKAEKVFSDFSSATNLPDMVYVYALSGNHVGSLLVKMVDYLPDKYKTTFSEALVDRYQRDTHNYIAYNLSTNAAAAAACSSIIEDFTDKKLKTTLNKIVLLSSGLPLKIASVYESDFDISEQIKRITRELEDKRYDNMMIEVNAGPITALGAITGIALTAGATQTPLIAALLAAAGLAAPPLGIAVVAVVAATAGGIFANSITKSFHNKKVPKLGGFDIAVAVLAHGYATLATILAQKDGIVTPQQSIKFYGEVFQRHYNVIIRDAFDPSLKMTLENATEGDRVKITHLLSVNKELRKIFANVNRSSKIVNDFGVSS